MEAPHEDGSSFAKIVSRAERAHETFWAAAIFRVLELDMRTTDCIGPHVLVRAPLACKWSANRNEQFIAMNFIFFCNRKRIHGK